MGSILIGSMMRNSTRFLLLGSALSALIGTPTVVLSAGQQGAPAINTLSIPASQAHTSAQPTLTSPSAQPQPSLEVPSLKFRSQPGYEQVTVTVTDSAGKYVTDLKADDFRVLENGQQRAVGYFRVDRSAPVSIGIVVDSSSSMESKFPQARAAIRRMVDDLDPRDDIFLEAFSAGAVLLQPFTFDHDAIIDGLKFLHPQTSTSLYDAVFLGLVAMRHGIQDKRALLVVTDGMDNTSKTNRAEVIELARAMKVLIYTIGIGEQLVDSKTGFFKTILRPDSDEIDMHTLKDLSDETGARAYQLRRVGDGAELSRDCTEISDELRQQYTLAYLSPDPSRPGYRPLKVEVPKHPELTVRVRKGVAMVPE
jgi:Ca-activated chloride channel homolog